MVRDSSKKGIISELYNMLLSNSNENSQYTLNAWKENFQIEITEGEWDACAAAQKVSINSQLKLIQYKW